MIVRNETPYPDQDVREVVEAAASLHRGPRPRQVVVKQQTSTAEDRVLGFTPFDHRLPMTIWLEPPDRYPQMGARSWHDELWQSALHEMDHYRNPACRGERCEDHAERYAQAHRRRQPRLTGWNGRYRESLRRRSWR